MTKKFSSNKHTYGEFVAYCDTLAVLPPLEVRKFGELMLRGYNVSLNENSSISTMSAENAYLRIDFVKNLYLVVSTVGSRRIAAPPIKFLPECGIEDGKIVNFNLFLENQPLPNRNYQLVYEDHHVRFSDFKADSIKVEKIGQRTRIVRAVNIHIAEVVGMCRLKSGKIFNDIDDPENGTDCKWFKIEITDIYAPQGVDGQAIIYDGERFAFYEKSEMRIKSDYPISWSKSDKEVLDVAVSSFVTEVLCG